MVLCKKRRGLGVWRGKSGAKCRKNYGNCRPGALGRGSVRKKVGSEGHIARRTPKTPAYGFFLAPRPKNPEILPDSWCKCKTPLAKSLRGGQTPGHLVDEFILRGGKEAQFPKGSRRIAFYTEFPLKRSDYGMDKLVGVVGSRVRMVVSLEAVKQ